MSTGYQNHLNFPHTTAGSGGRISNVFDAGGRKWQSVVAGVTTTYFGDIEYEGSSIKALYHADGRIGRLSNGTYEYQYYIKDHLGNTRVIFKNASTLLEMHYYPFGERACSSHKKWLVGEEKRNVHPASEARSGHEVKTLCAIAKVLLRKQEGNFYTAGTALKYKYNGKELISGMSWYDYGARHYDPCVGRFMGWIHWRMLLQT